MTRKDVLIQEAARYIARSQPRGFSEAREKSMGAKDYPYVAVLDTDSNRGGDLKDPTPKRVKAFLDAKEHVNTVYGPKHADVQVHPDAIVVHKEILKKDTKLKELLKDLPKDPFRSNVGDPRPKWLRGSKP